MSESTLNKLHAFLEIDKFSPLEWEKRGLNSSSSEICQLMTQAVNNCCNELIELCKEKSPQEAFKNSIKKYLSMVDKSQFDTEEREFIGDCFYELASIVSIDIKDELNIWTYGYASHILMKALSKIRGVNKVVETYSQNCTRCDSKLETFILKKQEGIPDHSYNIVKCNICGEFNLIDIGAGVASYNFGEYELVEQLLKSEYTLTQAEQRLVQIKSWRK